jgi:hypothetical protein
MELKDVCGNVKITGEYETLRVLCEKNGANLRGANLGGADLCGADLGGAKTALSDNTEIEFGEIISTLTNKYFIIITDTHIKIGCKSHTREQWDKFTDEEISQMDTGALEWWKTWKPIIMKISKGA